MLKIIKYRGLMLGVIAQFLQYGAALILLPLIVVCLSVEEVGIWYVFMTVQGLAMLMDFGFQPTFARNFALAFSGASELIKEGLADKVHASPNDELVLRVLYVARLIYAGVSIIVLMLLLTLGTGYIWSLIEGTSVSGKDVLYAWVIFAFAISVNLYFMWVSPFLIGADRVVQNYIYLIVNRTIFSLLGAWLLIAGYGLQGLALSYLLGVISARIFAIYLLRPIFKKLDCCKKVEFSTAKKELAIVWHNAGRMGLVSVGAFLIVRYNIFVVSYFGGLVAAASYGMAIQILMAINSVAQMVFQINVPKMVRARLDGKINVLRKLFYQSSLIYFVFFLSGAACLIVFGGESLDKIGSETKLLSRELMLLLAFIFLLEGNHSNSALTITTANRVPFVYPALISGFAIFLLSTTSGFLGFGLIGVILSQGVTQLCYNNWKWPLMVLNEIKTSANLKELPIK